jgi:hypothetical protein
VHEARLLYAVAKSAWSATRFLRQRLLLYPGYPNLQDKVQRRQ